jgi:hypothetical protein
VTAATETIPQPLIVDAVVDIDTPSRTLAVRLSENEQGYGRLLWKEAHAALVKAEQSGWVTGTPTLYASAPSAEKVAWATPGDFGMLLFRFPSGVAAFAELIGKPRWLHGSGLIGAAAPSSTFGCFISREPFPSGVGRAPEGSRVGVPGRPAPPRCWHSRPICQKRHLS